MHKQPPKSQQRNQLPLSVQREKSALPVVLKLNPDSMTKENRTGE